jgi:hypothetical protein
LFLVALTLVVLFCFAPGFALAKEIKEFGFFMQVPDSWESSLIEKDKQIFLKSPSSEQVIAGSTDLTSDNEQRMPLDELTESFISGMRDVDKELRILGRGNTTVGGLPANWIIVPLKTKDAQMNCKIFVIKKDKRLFSVMCLPYTGSSQGYDEILNKVEFF